MNEMIVLPDACQSCGSTKFVRKNITRDVYPGPESGLPAYMPIDVIYLGVEQTCSNCGNIAIPSIVSKNLER